jgi:hypothetical protein
MHVQHCAFIQLASGMYKMLATHNNQMRIPAVCFVLQLATMTDMPPLWCALWMAGCSTYRYGGVLLARVVFLE